jgi:hypothetical protein
MRRIVQLFGRRLFGGQGVADLNVGPGGLGNDDDQCRPHA